MLVVLAIITIITAVVLTSQSAFNKTLLLTNTAYDVALTFRFAETYGLGSRAFGGTLDTGYGLHFASGGASNSFILFADNYPSVGSGSVCHPAPSYDPAGPSAEPGNCAYDASQNEKVQSYALGNGITISNFCAQSNNVWTCSSNGALTSLDVVFARPNPTPYMSANGVYSGTFPVTAACITLTTPQGSFKYISVGASGQVSTAGTSCP